MQIFVIVQPVADELVSVALTPLDRFKGGLKIDELPDQQTLTVVS
ncbi:MAG: hypothetical protein ACXWTR_02985 [Methylotenera sp.]